MKLTVTTLGADGKVTEEVHEFAPDSAMGKALTAWQEAAAEHGCKCGDQAHPDHIEIVPRGHSVDVFCTDCGGFRQIG